jgi:hypothetical protein
MWGVMDLRSRAIRLLSMLSLRLRLLRLPRRWEFGLPRDSGLIVLRRLLLWSSRSFRGNEGSDEEYDSEELGRCLRLRSLEGY